MSDNTPKYCTKCKIEEGDYGLPGKDGKLWTIDAMDTIDNEDLFEVFADETIDNAVWIEVKLSKRDGNLYCSHCESVLFTEVIRNEQIIAARKQHEQTTGQMSMFPGLGND